MEANPRTVHSQTETDRAAKLRLGRLAEAKRFARGLVSSTEASVQQLRHGEVRVWSGGPGSGASRHVEALLIRLDTYTRRLTVRWYGRLVLQAEPETGRAHFDYDAGWTSELTRQVLRMIDPDYYQAQIETKRKVTAWIIADHARDSIPVSVEFTKRTTGKTRRLSVHLTKEDLERAGGEDALVDAAVETGLMKVRDERLANRDGSSWRQISLDAVRSILLWGSAELSFGAVGSGKGIMPSARSRRAPPRRKASGYGSP